MKDWTVVYTAVYPADAEMAKSLLEADGMAVFVKDELSAQVFGFSTFLGGVKLLVHPSDAPRATELLTRGGYNGPAEEEAEDMEEQ
jgi:hypothetical protein